MPVKLLTEQHLEFLSSKGGCTDLSESTLVKMSHCWKSHVAAHMTAGMLLNVLAILVKKIVIFIHIKISVYCIGTCMVGGKVVQLSERWP